MKITPNIGLWPTTEPNPLGRYLTSLTQLATLPVRVAWPGHGRPITEWPVRLAELQTHHQARLANMRAAADGASALTVAQRVFNFAKFSDHEVRFAVAETLAHLDYLVLHGELQRDIEAGTDFYHQ